MRNKFLYTGVVLLLVTSSLLAQSDSSRAKVTVTGENVCESCSLKKEKGAAAQCKVYGHRHGLRVAKMECDGHQAGKCGYSTALLHYLENDQSKDLIQGNHGEQVEVSGTLYGPESVLQVDSYKVLEGAGSESK